MEGKSSGRWSEIGRTGDASETDFTYAIGRDQQYTSARVGAVYTDLETTFSLPYPLRTFENETEGIRTHVHVHILCTKGLYICGMENVYIRKQEKFLKPIQLIIRTYVRTYVSITLRNVAVFADHQISHVSRQIRSMAVVNTFKA